MAEDQLPVVLPTGVEFKGRGPSPLSHDEAWLRADCEKSVSVSVFFVVVVYVHFVVCVGVCVLQAGLQCTERDRYNGHIRGLFLVLPPVHRPTSPPQVSPRESTHERNHNCFGGYFQCVALRVCRCRPFSEAVKSWMPVDLYVGGIEHG